MPASSLADGPQIAASHNPSGWRFTWESQSHSPTLRLLMFNSAIKPSVHCRDLKFKLFAEQFLLKMSFSEGEAEEETSVHVPIPRVLIDLESPIHFRTFEDHIEVKLVLLLPVNHPLVSDFHSVVTADGPRELFLNLKKLSGMEEIHFYCKSCSNKLTRGIRCFDEMPSINWRDVADNWFGSCCCSFGGVGEKLVAKYAKSYTCAAGVCLLNETSVLLCKSDVLGCEFPFPDVQARMCCESEQNSTGYSGCDRVLLNGFSTQEHANCGNQHEEVSSGDDSTNFLHSMELDVTNSKHEPPRNVANDDSLPCTSQALQIKEMEALMNVPCADVKYQTSSCDTGCCPSLDGVYDELLENQKVFLDGFLGNGFIVKSSSLSKDIKWTGFCCPRCSSLVGSYPCFEDHVSLDGGIRLFKCCISTCLPSSGFCDAFRSYTLERMFARQLLESAEEELSFVTIVRDIQTKSPVLQITLLNPNSWCCSGCSVDHAVEPVTKLLMYPAIKVLFSTCSNAMEIDCRGVDGWEGEKKADEEVYMFSSQLRELVRCLELSNSWYPQSYKSLQGMLLSSIRR
ncbi:hypothetical protein F511_04202 [Dorcoceras hygrometricum]|uniref:Ubiquitin-conjugating enzyme E2C-binding protein n=1 Tax=Dorcoceras hygrometricum TaxID=472368 RepID=A0A2Z7BIT5_9LAMI|nr:hypothetical protein F511_04202 [Dorcoceras hygrometricum]